jgi:hypothetical protein|tara:strand:+ start:1783 stop:1965 length:183 start_codon:yes stop_codon:yes gene_type:complete
MRTKPQMGITVSIDVADAIRNLAEQNGRKISSEIEIALRAHLKISKDLSAATIKAAGEVS